VNESHTHVDIVLRGSSGLVVIECKRANPAFSRWGFSRSQFRSTSTSELKQVRLDSLVWDEASRRMGVRRFDPEWTDDQFHVGLEIKTNDKGDADRAGRGALDEAVTQAVRGANGVINEVIRRDTNAFGLQTRVTVVPAVVTTARLLVTHGIYQMQHSPLASAP
jgi:hypothetical protein